MTGQLQGKVIIVTGATSGMGKSIARCFADEGASLMLTGRNSDRGKALVEELQMSEGEIRFCPADVSLATENEKLVRETLAAFGRIDMLSLNAGILGLGPVTDLEESLWHKTLDTNLGAIYYICKYAIPELGKNEGANILINASIAAFKSFPNHPAYCASKAGAVALMKQLAVDYAPRIRVNAICPGPVDTPLLHESAAAFKDPGTAVEGARKATLLKRLGTPEDIAKLALFLASDAASWITGTAVTIDGGILT